MSGSLCDDWSLALAIVRFGHWLYLERRRVDGCSVSFERRRMGSMGCSACFERGVCVCVCCVCLRIWTWTWAGV